MSCYACGLESADPENDLKVTDTLQDIFYNKIVQGSYGITPGRGKKMYNHSCDLMNDQFYEDSMWVRRCPKGVKGCFQAKGTCY